MLHGLPALEGLLAAAANGLVGVVAGGATLAAIKGIGRLRGKQYVN